jgi:hypothetical protein
VVRARADRVPPGRLVGALVWTSNGVLLLFIGPHVRARAARVRA